MALTDITISFDLAQILGSDFDPRRTKAYVTTNIANDTLMDTSTGETRLGDQTVTIADDGTGSFTTWAVGVDGNPASWQTTLVVDYPRTGQRDRKRRTFGPWTLAAADDGKNITALEDEQAIPAEYQTAFTAEMEAIQTASAANLAAQTVISGIDDTDSAVAGLIEDPLVGPLTTAALAVSIAELSPQAVPSFRGLKASLADATNSTGLGTLTDSTGVGTTRWPHRLTQALAIDYPAITFHARHWNDTTQDYDAPTVIQTGTAGERYMDMVAGNYPRRLRGVAHLTGAIDVRAKAYMADWTPGNAFGSEVLVGEAGGTGDWGWSFGVNSGGVLKMFYSTDGSTLGSIQANAVSGITDGSTMWVRCVFTPDDGAGNRVAKFYKSTDGTTWTQLGTTVTTVGAVTLSDRIAGGSTYLLGNQGAATNTSAVRIFEVDIRNGEAGAPIAPRLPEHWAYYGANTSHAIVGAPIFTLVNGAKSGATISYLNDATRKKLLTPDFGQQVTVLSSSHNEVGITGSRWATAYADWATSVRALVGPALVAITQNPEVPGVTGLYQTERARRRLDLLGFAKSIGLDLIDTYQPFIDYGPTWTTALMGDNVHPNAAGSDLQRDTIKAAFDLA